jgi:hypothetical protein
MPLPSGHMPTGAPGRGPHLAGSHSATIVVVAGWSGGSRHDDRSHFSPGPHVESSLQMPRAGRHSHGPMQWSSPAQWICSPAWQLGNVQPHFAIASGGTVPFASTAVSHGHW